LSPVLFLHQIPLHTLQPGFLKEDIPIQLDEQLNIQMGSPFLPVDGASNHSLFSIQDADGESK
jgi:hypothetical protein